MDTSAALTFVPLVALMALVYAAIQTLKNATNKQWNAVLTQVIVWAAGIGAAFLAANADALQHTVVAGVQLHLFDGWSLVLLGTTLGSVASVFHDTKAALDSSDSAVTPTLLPAKKAE